MCNAYVRAYSNAKKNRRMRRAGGRIGPIHIHSLMHGFPIWKRTDYSRRLGEEMRRGIDSWVVNIVVGD